MHIATKTRIAAGTRPLLLDTDLQIIFGITIMALYGSSIRIGQTLGPFAMGLLFPMVGINGVFFICAGIAFAMIGIVAGMID